MRHPSAQSMDESKVRNGMVRIMKQKIISKSQSQVPPLSFLWLILTATCVSGIAEEALGDCLMSRDTFHGSGAPSVALLPAQESTPELFARGYMLWSFNIPRGLGYRP